MKISDDYDELMDEVQFSTKMLAKPSNACSKQSARNMKALIQGKYQSFSHSQTSATNVSLISNELRDGSSFESTSPFYINESIKHPDTAFQSSRSNPQLPPVHDFAPIKRPDTNHLSDIHLKIQDLLHLKSPTILNSSLIPPSRQHPSTGIYYQQTISI